MLRSPALWWFYAALLLLGAAPLALIALWPAWTAIFIVPLAGLLLFWLNRVFWSGYDHIESGDNPQAGIYMRLGSFECALRPGEKFWLIHVAPKLFRVTKVSIKNRKIAVPIDQLSRDRLRIVGEATVELEISPDQTSLEKLFKIVRVDDNGLIDWTPLEEFVQTAAKDAFDLAISGFSQEQILGFALEIKALAKVLKGSRSTQRSADKIEADKQQLRDRLTELLRREARDWGAEVVDVYLNLDPDEAGRATLQRAEQEEFITIGRLSEARGDVAVASIREQGADPSKEHPSLREISRVHEQRTERLAAEQGGQLALIAQRLTERQRTHETPPHRNENGEDS